MSSKSILEAARQYLKWGWAVIPTVKKIPCIHYTELPHYYPLEKDLFDLYLQQFENHPEAQGIALVVGASMLVLDLDSSRAEEEFKDVTKNVTGIKTYRGSKYLFVDVRPDLIDHCIRLRDRASSAKFHIREDTEIILEGMLCELPPGLHASGKIHYEWLEEPSNGYLSYLPDALFNEVVRYGETRTEGKNFLPGELERLLKGLPEGEGRNEAAIRIAGHLIGKGNNWEVIESFLNNWNQKNDPPLSEKELSSVLESAYRYYEHKSETATIKEQAVEEITQEELSKIRSERYSPRIPNLREILDEHHLINVYCDWISSLSDTYYEYQVATALWLLSALTEGKVHLRVKQEVIKANLWMFLLGRSTTSRKSTAINKARDIYSHATDCELYNDDYSLEGYLKFLSKSPVCNLVRDEVAGLLAKNYKKYNEGIFDTECLIYDGQDFRKTLTKEEVVIKNPFVTHLYGTTLDSFTNIMQMMTVLGGYGFRFLYFAPDYVKPRKDIDLETDEDIEKWAEILSRVKKLRKFFDDSDIIDFKADPKALKKYNNVVANLETTIDKIGDSMLNSALGRYQIYILKLAMLIEIGKPEPSFTIHEDSMDLAISLVINYFLPSYQDVVERLEEDIKFNQVEKVISTLRKLGNTAPRYKLLKNSKLKQKDFDEVVITLVASKTISIKTITGTGGNDGEIFILEDVKLDLKSTFIQNPSFPSFTSFTSFPYGAHTTTNEVKEGKEGKTDIERARKMSFSSDIGERSEISEISETRTNSLSETLNKNKDSYQRFNLSVVSIEEGLRILKEEGY